MFNGGFNMPGSLTVPFDEDVLLMTNMTSQEFIDKTKFIMAATLWMDGKITAGQAAKMCGMGKAAFLYELPKHGYPMSNLGPDDLDDEMELARLERARAK
jgi:predicted HTH domain antitoxin